MEVIKQAITDMTETKVIPMFILNSMSDIIMNIPDFTEVNHQPIDIDVNMERIEALFYDNDQFIPVDAGIVVDINKRISVCTSIARKLNFLLDAKILHKVDSNISKNLTMPVTLTSEVFDKLTHGELDGIYSICDEMRTLNVNTIRDDDTIEELCTLNEVFGRISPISIDVLDDIKLKASDSEINELVNGLKEKALTLIDDLKTGTASKVGIENLSYNIFTIDAFVKLLNEYNKFYTGIYANLEAYYAIK